METAPAILPVHDWKHLGVRSHYSLKHNSSLCSRKFQTATKFVDSRKGR